MSSWEKITGLLGIFIGFASLVVAVTVPEIRCALPIIKDTLDCPKGYCKEVFTKNTRIEAKYKRTDNAHMQFGEVEDLEIDTSGDSTEVTGKVYLLKHPFSPNPKDQNYKDYKEHLVTSGQYEPYSNINPLVEFQVRFDKQDKWELDWYINSSTELLKGNGECVNATRAKGTFKYIRNQNPHTFNVIFDHID